MKIGVYNMEELIKEMEKLGYESEYALCNYNFSKTNQNIKTCIWINEFRFFKNEIDFSAKEVRQAIVIFKELEIIYKIMKVLRGDK